MMPIKKILCPTDFSEESEYGLDYAARLARQLSAQIKLVYIRTSIWPEAIQLAHEAAESTEDISNRLEAFCEETEREFGITCTHQIQITTDTFEETIAQQAKECDLIVMGTGGADDSYEYIFGSHTFHVIEKTKCPVMVVPKGYLFKPIQTLVYAYDPDTNPIFLIDQLKKIIEPLGTSVRVIHVAEDTPSLDTERKLTILREAVMTRAPKNCEWSFDSTYASDVSWALDKYVKAHGGDVLALSFHQRQFIEKIATQNVVKQMAMTAEYPVFIFWR